MLDQILNVLVQMYYKQLGKTQHFENRVEKRLLLTIFVLSIGGLFLKRS